jgi:putative ABC transport system substrate-binding protein
MGIASSGGAALSQPHQPLIVVLIHGKESAQRTRLEGLTEGLRELDYVEGRNYRMDVRWSDNHVDRLTTLARELLAKRPDVAVGFPVVSAHALQRESKTVPIVLASGAGAQRLGLIASLARPGGNVTGLDALVVLLDPNVSSFRSDVIAMATRLHVPSVYPTLEFADDGGLVAYSTDVRSQFRRAASYVDRILKGAKPADLPIERPTRFELVVNLKSARSLGIKIPQSVLVRADRVIE